MKRGGWKLARCSMPGISKLHVGKVSKLSDVSKLRMVC